MADVFDVAGASGAVYRFRRHREGEPLPAMAGNVLYVRQDGEAATVICCDEVDSLRDARGRWQEAQAAHGATDIYLRLNVGRTTRRQECDDVVENLRPPMAPRDRL
jgi:hypothetical protein